MNPKFELLANTGDSSESSQDGKIRLLHTSTKILKIDYSKKSVVYESLPNSRECFKIDMIFPPKEVTSGGKILSTSIKTELKNSYDYDLRNKNLLVYHTHPQVEIILEIDWRSSNALINANDEIAMIHIQNLLRSYHIDCIYSTGFVSGVWVSQEDVEQVQKILHEDALKRRYWLDIQNLNFSCREPQKQIQELKIPFDLLLKKPEYSPNTILGRFLRGSKVTKQRRKYPFVVSLAEHQRLYLATPKKLCTGYNFQLTLARTSHKDAPHCQGDFQIGYDGKILSPFGFDEL